MKKSFPMGHKEKKIHFSSVSGVATTKPELIRWFSNNIPEVEVITTKSFQVRPNGGNREPVICETESGNLGNSVGLRNPGLEVSLPPLKVLKEEGLPKWLNVSLSADNPDDFITLIKAFDSVADSVELNFSCPHAKKGFGASIGSDITIASEYVEKIHEATRDRSSLLFIKLTPNVDNIGEIARSVIEKGADGISAINTVGPALHTDPVSGTPILQNALGGKGGKSGRWVFDRAKECIKEIREAVGDDVPIIGMGGVWSGEDAAALVEAGADAVGVGSVLSHVRQYNWPSFFSSLLSDGEKALVAIKSDAASVFLEKERQMAYSRFIVDEKRYHSDDTIIITLSGEMKDFKAGEFVFLWIPGV
ncbi:MAG: dihydroorotate dehydrogenase, partial [Candidatus Ornithospirochaeta sp.]